MLLYLMKGVDYFLDTLKMFKALGDKSRLDILMALKAEGPMYVELLTQRLNLSQSTVSFHLKKLVECNLVHSKKEQYYVVFSLNEDILNLALIDFLGSGQDVLVVQRERESNYRHDILNTYIIDGKITSIPVQKEKKKIIFEYILEGLNEDKGYTTGCINKYLKQYTTNYKELREELVEGGYLINVYDVLYLSKGQAIERKYINPLDYRRFLYQEENGVYLIKENVYGEISKLDNKNTEGELLFTNKGRIILKIKEGVDYFFTYHFLGEENKDVIEENKVLFGGIFFQDIYHSEPIKAKIEGDKVICKGENLKLRGEGGLHGFISNGSISFELSLQEFEELKGKVYKEMFSYV